jgi:hypothetical protein
MPLRAIINFPLLVINVLVFLTAGDVTNASAETASKSSLNCDIYNQLDQHCRCEGEENYLIRYGRRYCERFLNATGWTPAGATWRDRTLMCLEDSLTQRLTRKPPDACDCKAIKKIAVETHIRCYTQETASVCRLPFSDWRKIYQIIDARDLFDPEGLSQMMSIWGICAGQHN